MCKFCFDLFGVKTRAGEEGKGSITGQVTLQLGASVCRNSGWLEKGRKAPQTERTPSASCGNASVHGAGRER